MSSRSATHLVAVIHATPPCDVLLGALTVLREKHTTPSLGGSSQTAMIKDSSVGGFVGGYITAACIVPNCLVVHMPSSLVARLNVVISIDSPQMQTGGSFRGKDSTHTRHIMVQCSRNNKKMRTNNDTTMTQRNEAPTPTVRTPGVTHCQTLVQTPWNDGGAMGWRSPLLRVTW
jgi:hypothetical protein